MEEAASSLPVWAQHASVIAIAFISTLIGVFKYLKTESKAAEPVATGATSPPSVISASFIDSKLLKELIEAMRELQDEQGRDAKKSHRLSQDLREAVNELNESIIVQTDAHFSLMRFLAREATRHRS